MANVIKKVKIGTTEYDIHAKTADSATNATNAVNATNATTASKIGTSTVGGTTRPVYIKNGVPTQLNYTIGKSVPSNAVFTDTITTNVIVSATQPTGQRVGDFWYKTV